MESYRHTDRHTDRHTAHHTDCHTDHHTYFDMMFIDLVVQPPAAPPVLFTSLQKKWFTPTRCHQAFLYTLNHCLLVYVKYNIFFT